jgi:hypothetical protein
MRFEMAVGPGRQGSQRRCRLREQLMTKTTCDPGDGIKPARKPGLGKKAKFERGPRGAFLPGNKEGAAGRPKGSRNRTTLMIEAMLEGEAEGLTRALIVKAKKGYAVPLQLVFERLAPTRKDRHIELKLPPIATIQDLLAAQAAIIEHAAAGEITPSEAHIMASLLDLRRKTIETCEIEARLAALEARPPVGATS